jgi:hypothetical protein
LGACAHDRDCTPRVEGKGRPSSAGITRAEWDCDWIRARDETQSGTFSSPVHHFFSNPGGQ